MKRLVKTRGISAIVVRDVEGPVALSHALHEVRRFTRVGTYLREIRSFRPEDFVDPKEVKVWFEGAWEGVNAREFILHFVLR